MPGTRVRQTRVPIRVDSGTKYQITTVCILAGTLPSKSIFLLRVQQDNDPKNDTLERLCEVVDFDDYGESRNASITANTFLYRAASITLSYDSLPEADGAWRELSSRINGLVEQYDTYLTAFLTGASGTEILYPTVDPGVKAALVAAYVKRLEDIAEAEEARDAGQRECDADELELRSLQQQLEQAQSDLAAVLPIKAAVDSLITPYIATLAQYTASKDAIRTTNASSSASAPDKAAIEAQLIAIEGALSTHGATNTAYGTSLQTPIGVLAGNLQSRVNSLTQQTSAQQLAVNACHLDMAGLQAAVDQARKQRDADLEAIRAVCPDFNPDTDIDGILAGDLPLLLGGDF